MIYWRINGIIRIDGSQAALGGSGVRFLGVRDLGDYQYVGIRPVLQNLRHTAQASSSSHDNQDIT
jgi:hypothetical protein